MILNGGVRMIITREKILEERCNNNRNMFKDLCETYKLDRCKIANDYNMKGFLTINDTRYLVGLCDFEDLARQRNRRLRYYLEKNGIRNDRMN